MKNIATSFCTAFSLYSSIPMPKTSWTKDSIKYSLCFFPMIGVVIGVLLLLWFRVCRSAQIVPALFAGVATVIPIIVTGGIHLDGFIDTTDAISSHALMDKKMEILKDPHVGAFGVIFCASRLLVEFCLWQQLFTKPKLIIITAVGYILSRCLNAVTIATFTPAKSSGLVYLFSDTAVKPVVVFTNICVCALVVLFCTVSFGFYGILVGTICTLYFLLHKRFCMWEFGGNTGDLAGFFLQNLELMLLILVVVGGLV